MTTISQYLSNLKQLRATILDEQGKAVRKLETQIIRKNIDNIEDHIGADGQELKNSNPMFSGYYKKSTEEISKTTFSPPLLPKIAGQPYNWIWTGVFIGNFHLDINAGQDKIKIYSTGTGTGEKADFFKGYKNLYGLTKEDQIWLNNEITKHLQQHARKYI